MIDAKDPNARHMPGARWASLTSGSSKPARNASQVLLSRFLSKRIRPMSYFPLDPFPDLCHSKSFVCYDLQAHGELDQCRG
jgi:hypothetical protein